MCGKIKIYDDIMGSGKTETIITKMYEADNKQKFIYISPFLDECHRIAGTTFDINDDLKRPIIVYEDGEESSYDYDSDNKLSNMTFKHPIYGLSGNKMDSFESLIQFNMNIVSTHQLFKNISSSMADDLKNYILVIDEELSINEIVSEYNIEEIDKLLHNLKWLYLDSDGITLRFNYDNFSTSDETPAKTYYEKLANMCDMGQLLYSKGKVLVWELSREILKSFKEVWLATYMFEGSMMSSYLKVHGYEYELMSCGGNKPSYFKNLISIVDDQKYNSIGDKKTALSSTYYSSNRISTCEQLKKNLYNFTRSKCKVKANDLIWTTFKIYTKPISGGNYASRWLPSNIRSSNAYKDCTAIAYLINVYSHPFLSNVMSMRGEPIDEDKFALLQMIQFIWRSSIRQEPPKPINVYIPSKRMRDIFIRWLNDEFEHTRNIEN